MIYVARKPLNTGGVDVQVIGETLATIRLAHDGLNVPAVYVEAARPEDSPVHNSLPWDKKDELFEAMLRRRAAEFCQWIVVEQQDWPNANVELVSSTSGECVRGYMEVAIVQRQEPTRQQVIRSLLATIKGTLTNHAWLTELQPIADAVTLVEQFLDTSEDQKAA
jgi:hypothetical protein